MKNKKEKVIIDGITYVPENTIQNAPSLDGKQCMLIRSYADGVHFGYVDEIIDTPAGRIVKLLKSRRVWKWSGAATLSQLAMEGSNDLHNCRIAMELPVHIVVNVVGMTPLTKHAFNNLYSAKAWKV